MATPTPLQLLEEGVASLAGGLQPDGTLHDPVFATPTQYGSAYYGWCCAVLAGRAGTGAGAGAEDYRERAQRILATAAAHTADPALAPYASGFNRRTLGVVGHLNHRDFTWPPILKTYLAVGQDRPELRDLLASVDLEASFRTRPPSNWAAVWMSGEWLRMQAGLSPTTAEQFDDWVGVFFERGDRVGLATDIGMYLERGLPNAYDLFTRAHFTDLLLQGYDGHHRERLEQFLRAGLRRSLVMQLSDGSMASGFRSTGQTWVLGAQIALFTGSRVLGLGTDSDRASAGVGAWRAYRSLATWQRLGGPFSPVQNLLPPELRVGYENYTADGHYSSLTLAFLASAIDRGFGADAMPSAADLDHRDTEAFAEGPPTFRGVVHRGRVSAAVQTQPDDNYDATGLVDLTFGSGRLLQFVSSARHLSGGGWLNPGLALRPSAELGDLLALSGCRHEPTVPLVRLSERSLGFESMVRPGAEQTLDDLADGQAYRCEVVGTDTGVQVTESTPGRAYFRTLVIPYPRDVGATELTGVELLPTGVRFTLGAEQVEFRVDGDLVHQAHLPYGYENRRALCGLVRLDLREPGEVLRWEVTSS